MGRGSSHKVLCCSSPRPPGDPRSPVPAGPLAHQHKQAVCAAASGREAGKAVWPVSPARWELSHCWGSDQNSAELGTGGWTTHSNSQATHPLASVKSMGASEVLVARGAWWWRGSFTSQPARTLERSPRAKRCSGEVSPAPAFSRSPLVFSEQPLLTQEG